MHEDYDRRFPLGQKGTVLEIRLNTFANSVEVSPVSGVKIALSNESGLW